jgi:hypothetical protein
MDHQQQELLLALVEKSVRVIPLDKEEWEAKAGLAAVSVSDADDGDDDNGDNKDDEDKDEDTVDSSIGSTKYSLDGRSLIFPTLSNLRKACLSSPSLSSAPTSSPTSSKARDRKALIAALEKWIFQNHWKPQRNNGRGESKHHNRNRNHNHNPKGVSVLSNSGLEGATNPRSLLDLYVSRVVSEEKYRKRASQEESFVADKAAAATPQHHYHEKVQTKQKQEQTQQRNNKQRQPGKLGCALLQERDSSRSLLLRSHNTLLDGEVFSSSSNSNSSSHSNSPSNSTTNSNGSPSRTAILRCAASLYYRIWYFRTIHKKDLRRAYGFAVASSVSSSGKRVTLRISLLLLEKPSGNLRDGPSIGGRYPLYVYKTRYDLPEPGRTSSSSSSSSALSPPLSSSKVLYELSQFLYCHSKSWPCPYKDSRFLTTVRSSPGGMLLPDEPVREPPTERIRKKVARAASGVIIPIHHLEGCKIIPTITSSLVIYCRDSLAVRELLKCSGGLEEEGEDPEGMKKLIKAFTTVATNNSNSIQKNENEWYVKFKTPSFGLFWDTSRSAINGPRGGLLKKGRNESSHLPCIRRWLFLHPVDSWVGSFRSITITRSAGVAFSRAVQEYGMSWASYQREFLGLVKSTLRIQACCNSLVHGDIHEGNLLYYHHHHHRSSDNNDDKDKDKDKDNNSDIESVKSSHHENDKLFPIGQQLVLIDWDEASRPKPFRRNTLTDEERLRYPEGLLDFPEQYTQQQLMHLFGKLAMSFFPSETTQIVSTNEGDSDLDNAWMVPLLVPPPPEPTVVAGAATTSTTSTFTTTTITATPESYTKFLGRSAVEQRFKAMLRGLEGIHH